MIGPGFGENLLMGFPEQVEACHKKDITYNIQRNIKPIQSEIHHNKRKPSKLRNACLSNQLPLTLAQQVLFLAECLMVLDILQIIV